MADDSNDNSDSDLTLMQRVTRWLNEIKGLLAAIAGVSGAAVALWAIINTGGGDSELPDSVRSPSDPCSVTIVKNHLAADGPIEVFVRFSVSDVPRDIQARLNGRAQGSNSPGAFQISLSKVLGGGNKEGARSFRSDASTRLLLWFHSVESRTKASSDPDADWHADWKAAGNLSINLPEAEGQTAGTSVSNAYGPAGDVHVTWSCGS